jgi:hypothetical protein
MITKDESSNENSTLGFIHQTGEFSTLRRVWTMKKTSEEVHLELCHPSELPSVLLPDRCTYPNDSPQLQTRSESLRLHQCSTRERDLRRCTTCAGIAPRWVRTVGVGDDVCGSSRSTATRAHSSPLLLPISGPDRSLTHSRCPQGTGTTYVDWEALVFPQLAVLSKCGLGPICFPIMRTPLPMWTGCHLFCHNWISPYLCGLGAFFLPQLDLTLPMWSGCLFFATTGSHLTYVDRDSFGWDFIIMSEDPNDVISLKELELKW